jgi:hypothetical protein
MEVRQFPSQINVEVLRFLPDKTTLQFRNEHKTIIFLPVAALFFCIFTTEIIKTING